MTQFLAIKNYDRFQHYKDRNPLWIKFYNSVLDDYAVQQLPETQQRHLFLIWLLASRHGNRIPFDPKWIARTIHARSKLDLQAMIDAGFLTVVADGPAELLPEPEQHAIGVLAEPEHPASPRALAERRGREETETEKNSSSSGRSAREQLLAMVPNRRAWEMELDAALDGMHGPKATSVQLEIACRDYLGNGDAERPSLAHFRRYIKRAVEADRPPPRRNGSKPSTAPAPNSSLAKYAERFK
jgi:hypothetical protein